MGLAGSLNTSVTGLRAQSDATGVISDNIANANTTGYKSVKSSFSSLVTDTGTASGYSSGGVNMRARFLIDEQGLIESTGRVTDLAVSGSGFFAVQDEGSNTFFTRNGAFNINSSGELVNSSNFKLMGWALDDDGNRPGEGDNVNTTSAESLESLSVVDTNAVSGTATPTTTTTFGMNLNAGQTTFQGATVTLDPQSTANATGASDDIIVPTTSMQQGDSISFTTGGLTSKFVYGGFAKSYDVANGIFGATTSTAIFSTSSANLSDGERFTITSLSSGTTTFKFKATSPSTANGEFNSLNTLATAIDAITGLTARVSGGVLYVSSTDATEALTFADVGSSNLHAELGLGNVAAAAASVNRWNTFDGLSTLVNATSQLGAVINNSTANAEIEIYGADPVQSMVVEKHENSVTLDLMSSENGANGQSDLIIPVLGTAMANGNTIVINDDQDAAGTSVTATYGGVAASKDITTGGGILGATTTTANMSTLSNGDQITFSNGAGGTVLVTYDDTDPVAASGQFSSLATLALAIDADADFHARVVNNKLYVSSADADNAITFAATTGTTLLEIDELAGDFASGGTGTTAITASGGATRFATMLELQSIIDASAAFTATIANTAGNATVTVTGNAGTETIEILDSSDDLVKELGIADNNDIGDGFFAEMALDTLITATTTTDADLDGLVEGTVDQTYDPSNTQKSMASGSVTPHFSRNVTIFDSLGTAHSFQMAFLKTGTNTWATELYAITASEVSGVTDGQVTSGNLTFKGDGTLSSIDAALSTPLTINWSTGADASTVTLDLGTVNLADGVRQFDASYNIEFVEQNGVAAGQFNGVTVDEDGFVIANFSNGETKRIYQLPIVVFANDQGLTSKSGNVYASSSASGTANLKKSGQGGAGSIVSGSLEGSTSDISEELTNLISAQFIYNGNATNISIIRDMLQELNQRL